MNAPAPSSNALPRFYTDAVGDRRVLQRIPRITPAPRVYCPDGHFIHTAGITLEEDTFRCGTRIVGGAVCGLHVFVISEFHGSENVSLLLSMEVTSDEIKRFRRWPLIDKLRYLEVLWPGVRS